METPEDIFARNKRDAADKLARIIADRNAPLVAQIKPLVRQALDHQQRLGNSSNSYLALEELQWQGEPRVGWKLRGCPGDGDYSGQVFLIPREGILIVSVRDKGYTDWHFEALELPHTFTPDDLQKIIERLENLAGIDPSKHTRRRRRWS